MQTDWYYDDADMLELDGYDEPDADSDFDYEESYTKRRKNRRGSKVQFKQIERNWIYKILFFY